MQYKGRNVTVHHHQYNNGRPAVELRDAMTGEPIAKATVNLPQETPGEGEVFIKNWSENEGMLDWLVENGLVEDTGRAIPGGFAEAPIVRLKKH